MCDVVANVRSEGCDKLAKENALPGEERIHFEESRHIYWVRLNDQTVRVAKSVTSLKAQLFDEFDSDAVIKKNMPNWASNYCQTRPSEYGRIVRHAVGDDARYITSDNLEVISFFIANKTTFKSIIECHLVIVVKSLKTSPTSKYRSCFSSPKTEHA